MAGRPPLPSPGDSGERQPDADQDCDHQQHPRHRRAAGGLGRRRARSWHGTGRAGIRILDVGPRSDCRRRGEHRGRRSRERLGSLDTVARRLGRRRVLLGGDTRVALGAGDASRGSRLEGDPADTVEPDLRPGMRVLAEHAVPAVLTQPAGGVSDSHTRGDPERARHGGEGCRELLAVPGADLQEVLDRVRSVTGLDLGAVVERTEPVLQSDHSVVVGRGTGGHLSGEVVHHVGQVVGQLEEDVVGWFVGRGGAQRVGRYLWPRGLDRELLARHEVARLEQGARVDVEPHVSVGGDLLRVGGGRQQLATELEDLDLLHDRAAACRRTAGLLDPSQVAIGELEGATVELGERGEPPVRPRHRR